MSTFSFDHRLPRVRASVAVFGRGWFLQARVVLALCVCLLLAGCSNNDGRIPVFPVEGKITVAGEVPEGALIVLYPARADAPAELRPSAKVVQDGTFRLTTYDANDGAPAGEYVATIQWNRLIKKGADYVAGPDAVPKEYTSRETSPWKLTIAEKRTVLDPLVIKK